MRINYQVHQVNNQNLEECAQVFNSAFSRTSDPVQLSSVWYQAITRTILEIYVAQSKSMILGFGGLSKFSSVGFIGYMSTLPQYQRQGIGFSIIRSILQRCVTLNLSSVALFASFIGKPLYQKFGFLSDFRATRYVISKEIDIIKNHSISDIKVDSCIHPWIYSLDRAIYGYDRKEFLDFLINLSGKVISIGEENYCFILGNIIGPLIAQTSECTVLMIKTALTLGANRIIIPDSKIDDLKTYLRLIPERNATCDYMTYGTPIPMQQKRIYGFYSFATG